jgi:predicted DNA-binding transcriptional regulator AlpA
VVYCGHMNTASTPIDQPTLLLTPRVAAKLLSVSRAQLFKLHSSGKLGPMPVYLGSRAPRWVRSELEEWLRAGAPCRQTWQALRGAGR